MTTRLIIGSMMTINKISGVRDGITKVKVLKTMVGSKMKENLN